MVVVVGVGWCGGGNVVVVVGGVVWYSVVGRKRVVVGVGVGVGVWVEGVEGCRVTVG